MRGVRLGCCAWVSDVDQLSNSGLEDVIFLPPAVIMYTVHTVHTVHLLYTNCTLTFIPAATGNGCQSPSQQSQYSLSSSVPSKVWGCGGSVFEEDDDIVWSVHLEKHNPEQANTRQGPRVLYKPLHWLTMYSRLHSLHATKDARIVPIRAECKVYRELSSREEAGSQQCPCWQVRRSGVMLV